MNRATKEVADHWVTLSNSSADYGLVKERLAAATFFVQKYDATNTFAFHNTNYVRQIALQGPDGVLLYMVDVKSPNATTIPSGYLMEWATFTMEGNVVGVNDGSALENRTFVAVKDADSETYTLALYDGM